MGEIAAGAESPPAGGPGGETVCSELVPDVERLKCYDNAAAQRRTDFGLNVGFSKRFEAVLDCGTDWHGRYVVVAAPTFRF